MADLVLNQYGFLVRKQSPKAIRPALERFFEHVEERDCGQEKPCLIWTGAPYFRINAKIVLRPWRYFYEIDRGERTPNGAGWNWTCGNTSLCCEPDHMRIIAKYCRTDEL